MILMETEPLYRTEEVCALVGCSYRQLDYWTRTELIKPHTAAQGSGSQRLFSEDNLREVRILRDLSEVAGSGGASAAFWRRVRERGAEATLIELWTTFDALATKYGLG